MRIKIWENLTKLLYVELKPSQALIALENWQKKSLDNFLRAMGIISIPILLIVGTLEVQRETYGILLIFIAASVFTNFLAWSDWIPWKTRGWLTISLLFLLGTIGMIRGGLAGDGRAFLLLLPILGMVIIDINAMVILLFISLGEYLLFAYLANAGILERFLVYPHNPTSYDVWLVEGAVIYALLFLTSLLLRALYQLSIDAINLEAEAKQKIEEQNVLLVRSNKERSFLAQQLIINHEEDRKYLARELHDDILSDLSLAPFDVNDSNSISEYVERIKKMTTRLRQTINDLRPPVLNFGLLSALEQLVESIQQIYNNQINIILTIPSNSFRYDEEVEQHIYRIVQQACHNALRHGKANVLEISGEMMQDSITIEVRDDGKGFDYIPSNLLAEINSKNQFGIINIKERALMINAELNIKSTENEGTRIILDWENSPEPAINLVK